MLSIGLLALNYPLRSYLKHLEGRQAAFIESTPAVGQLPSVPIARSRLPQVFYESNEILVIKILDRIPIEDIILSSERYRY